MLGLSKLAACGRWLVQFGSTPKRRPGNPVSRLCRQMWGRSVPFPLDLMESGWHTAAVRRGEYDARKPRVSALALLAGRHSYMSLLLAKALKLFLQARNDLRYAF